MFHADTRNPWQATKEQLRSELTPGAYGLWFDRLRMRDFSDNILTVTTDSRMTVTVLTNKYMPELANAVCRNFGAGTRVRILHQDRAAAPISPEA